MAVKLAKAIMKAISNSDIKRKAENFENPIRQEQGIKNNVTFNELVMMKG